MDDYTNEGAVSALDTSLMTIVSWMLVALSFVIPVFVIPWSIISFEFSKSFLLVGAVVVMTCIWLYGVLKTGRVVLPKSIVLLSMLLLPVTSLISALFSETVYAALIGQGFETTTFAVVTVLTFLACLTATLCNTKSRAFSIYMAFFAVITVLGIHHALRLFLGADFLAFGTLTGITDSLVGGWYDLAGFFGVGALLSLIALETLTLARMVRAGFYLFLIGTLIALAIINAWIVWVLLGVLALILFIYLLSFRRSAQRMSPEGELISARGQTSKLSIGIFFLSLLFVLAGGLIGDEISSRLNTRYVEVGPSWSATYNIALDTFKENPVLGTGPNTFVREWIKYKPLAVNTSRFWNTDFNFGVGYVPTVVATGGALGLLAWIVFFATFVYAGFRAVLRHTSDSFSYYLMVSSFFSALLLWLMAVFTTPGIALLTVTAIMTGVFVASLVAEGMIEQKVVEFTENPRAGFFATSATIVIFVIMLALAYGYTTRFVSFALFQSGLQTLDADLNLAQTRITQAANIHNSAVYQRALSEIHILQINDLLREGDLSQEETVNEFQTYFSSALTSARNATEINKFDYQNWLALARVYGAVTSLNVEGAYEAAGEHYRRAQEFNPKSPLIELSLAQLAIANADNDTARGFIAQALQKKPNYTNAIFLLAQIEVSEGNVAQAIRSAEQAALIAPDDPGVYFQIGILKYNNNDFAGAVESLTKAIELDAGYDNARYFLGLALYEVGESEGSLEQFEILESNNPDNELITSILANLNAGNAPISDTASDEELDELPIDESVE